MKPLQLRLVTFPWQKHVTSDSFNETDIRVGVSAPLSHEFRRLLAPDGMITVLTLTNPYLGRTLQSDNRRRVTPPTNIKRDNPP